MLWRDGKHQTRPDLLHVVCVLLAAGSNVNSVDSNGATPLHLAAIYGSCEIIGELIAAGADIHIKDKKGKTAVDLARNSELRRKLLAGLHRE